MPVVVVSLKPLHALVSAVAGDVFQPHLLLRGSLSPHGYSLRPSAMRWISQADRVIWAGPPMEGFLVGVLDSHKPPSASLALLDSPALELLPRRDVHGHVQAGQIDGHFWLDPRNAIAVVPVLVASLSALDPDHRAQYQRNGARLSADLQRLDRQLSDALAGVRDQPIVVFHDAFQYFARRYHLNVLASVSADDHQRPGARRLRELRHLVQEAGVACVFIEPGTPGSLVEVVTEDSNARIAVLDPLGIDLPPGRDAYFDSLRSVATSVVECLGDTGGG